jgi:hypothetical protein
VKELLAETVNRRRAFEVLRMPSSSFVQLAKWCVQQGVLCRSRKRVTIEEQLAIFLYIMGHNSSNKGLLRSAFNTVEKQLHGIFNAAIVPGPKQ